MVVEAAVAVMVVVVAISTSPHIVQHLQYCNLSKLEIDFKSNKIPKIFKINFC